MSLTVKDGNGVLQTLATKIVSGAHQTLNRLWFLSVSGSEQEVLDDDPSHGLPVQVVDGANECLGASDDAIATAGSIGTVAAKLRYVTFALSSLAGSLTQIGAAGVYTIQAVTAVITNTTDVVVIAGSAGYYMYLRNITLANKSTGVETVVEVFSSTTVLFRTVIQPSQTLTFTFPAGLRGVLNSGIGVRCLTTGAAVYASISGHKWTT